MAIKPGESYAAQVQVVKIRRGQPTVVMIDGKRYVMEPNK